MESSIVLISDATDHENLCAALQRIDISVPGRTEGRTKQHTERWTIYHLISTLANAGRISYPLSLLLHRDKPDFLVCMGNAEIGVEVTEAIPENFAAYSALQQREFPDAITDLGHFRPGRHDLSTQEMRQLLGPNAPTSKGWGGLSAEIEWADSIRSVVDKKLQKLAQSGFRKFERNWLSVYDNLPKPSLDLEEAIGFLQPLLQDRWQRSPAFDTLFIEQGQTVIRITANDSEQLALNDLWRLPETTCNPNPPPSGAPAWQIGQK